MEQFQKNKNIEDQHIYNKIRTASMKKTLDKLKNRPDSSFLENLPHFESDPSLKNYIRLITNILYNDKEKEPDEWLEDLLEDKFDRIPPPLSEPERILSTITGKNKLSGTDQRYSRYLLKQQSADSVSQREKSKNKELRRRKAYHRFIVANGKR